MVEILATSTTPSQQIITALTSGFTDASSAMIDGVVAIIPIALPVFAGFLTIGYGIKVFRKLTGRA